MLNQINRVFTLRISTDMTWGTRNFVRHVTISAFPVGVQMMPSVTRDKSEMIELCKQINTYIFVFWYFVEFYCSIHCLTMFLTVIEAINLYQPVIVTSRPCALIYALVLWHPKIYTYELVVEKLPREITASRSNWKLMGNALCNVNWVISV